MKSLIGFRNMFGITTIGTHRMVCIRPSRIVSNIIMSPTDPLVTSAQRMNPRR